MKYTPIELPPYISRKAFFSIPFFFINAIVAYNYKYERLAALLIFLTYTSFAYWNHAVKMNLIKAIDIMIACTTVYSSVFIDSYSFTETNRLFFWGSSMVSISVFIMNDYWYYYSIDLLNDLIKPNNKNATNTIMIDEKKINKWIEKIHYRSVFIHMFFLHVLPCVSCMYCIIYST